jgi:hypothetical protein
MIRVFILIFILEITVLLVVLVIGWLWFDKRYRLTTRDQKIPSGYNLTAERFIDPTSQKVFRVYYDPLAGKRLYVEE